ncbi:MAG: hypothetical protein ACO3NI_06655 [bacterium]
MYILLGIDASFLSGVKFGMRSAVPVERTREVSRRDSPMKCCGDVRSWLTIPHNNCHWLDL